MTESLRSNLFVVPVVLLLLVVGVTSVVLAAGHGGSRAETGSTPTPISTPVDDAVRDAGLAATVLVRGEGCAVDTLGTGFVVGGEVVTNAHVVAGVTSVEIRDAAGRFLDAEVVAFDPVVDLALLRAEGLGDTGLSFADPRPGPAIVVGRVGADEAGAEALDAQIARVITIVFSDIYGGGSHERPGFEVDGAIGPGDSGGAVINGSGEVVGIVFSSSRRRDEVGYATSSSAIVDFLALPPRVGVDNGSCVG